MDNVRYYYFSYPFSSAGLVTRLRAGRKEIFVYVKAFTPGMETTLSPIQWISLPLPRGG